jgi:hypothetical protein
LIFSLNRHHTITFHDGILENLVLNVNSEQQLQHFITSSSGPPMSQVRDGLLPERSRV